MNAEIGYCGAISHSGGKSLEFYRSEEYNEYLERLKGSSSENVKAVWIGDREDFTRSELLNKIGESLIV